VNKQAVEGAALAAGATVTGGLAAAGHFFAMIEPILADFSYAAAILVAVVSIYYKIRNRGE
jgi:hypothetical protein